MRDGLLALGTGLVAVVCCLGISLAAAAGATTLLSLAGLALPLAAIVGMAAWAIWYRASWRRHGRPRTPHVRKDHMR